MTEGRRIAWLGLLQHRRVQWGSVNKKTSSAVRWLIEKCLVWQEFRRASTAWGTKIVKEDLLMIFPVASTKITVSAMGLTSRAHLLAITILRVAAGLHIFCVSTPRAFFSHKQKEKRGAQGQVGSSDPPVRPSKLFFQFFL